MIIFDLDGTLADCEHRRHFIDISKSFENDYIPAHLYFKDEITDEQRGYYYHVKTGKKWKPDWKAFYEACDKDEPIQPVIDILDRCIRSFLFDGTNNPSLGIEIWSGRCESVRKKTENWLRKYKLSGIPLKMRPIGDSTPDDVLKEKWLDEAFAEGKRIDFVFDDRPKVVRMWRKRGIFVFDCNQSGKEF